MQKKAELIGGPQDGELTKIKKEPISTLITAGIGCIHQYTLKERHRDGKAEWYYEYLGSFPIGKNKL